MHFKKQMNEITIFLTENDAVRFKEFQQNYDNFMLLINKGVFEIKNGSAVLNFDSNGKITTIQRADMLYNSRIEKKFSTD